MQKESFVLDPTWQFKEFPESARRMRDLDAGDWLSASVPSSIYTCLEQAGVISIPELPSDFHEIQWVDQKNWVFRKTFDVPPSLRHKERIEIVFDGLDTVTHIWLNEKLIGKTENMFIPHRFDIKPYLKETGNQLYIKFVSASHCAGRFMERYGKLGTRHLRDPRSAYIRKAAYQFGSDVGPSPAGCGIFRNIRIEAGSTATIENLHLRTIDCSEYEADIRVALELNRINNYDGLLKGRIIMTGGGLDLQQEILFNGEDRIASTVLHIERPFLWWPTGYGVPHLYHIRAELMTSEGQLLDAVSADFGVRTVHIENSSGKTECIVNGQPVRLKGADWMPLSLFPGTQTDNGNLLKKAKECHINMLRLWAGGYYEEPEFYRLCDQMGILVWQNFMFDSGYYPDRQWFLDMVKNEAETIIRRLRNHTCIVLWCGNNNIDHLHKIGKLGTGRKFYGKPIYYKLLPQLVHELDPDREYLPTHSQHTVENETPVLSVPDISSMPNHSTLSTLKDFRHSFGIIEKLTGSDSTLQQIAHGQITEFSPPENLSEYIRQSQLIQARQAKNAVEHFRSVGSFADGCMLGALNDFTLSISPAMFDADRQPKALYDYARRFFASILVTLFPDGKTGLLKAYVVNDTASPVTGVLSCRMMTVNGKMLDATEMPLRVSPFSREAAVHLPKSLSTPENPMQTFLHICIKNNDAVFAENTYFYRPDKQIKWPAADMDLQISPDEDGSAWNVTLTSEVLVRDLQISPPRPADISDNFLTLLPNEPKQIRISYHDPAPPIRTPLEIFSANQF